MPLFSPLLACIVPLLFLAVFLFAAVKKVKIYDAFTEGAKQAVPLLLNIFPYLVTIFILSEIFEQSGLSDKLCDFLSTPFSWLGIPPELIKLVVVKPFSGSGATALFAEILQNNPPDSYVSRCAAVCFGSSETIFYVSAVYFANVKDVKLTSAVLISLVSCFLGVVLSCFLCKLM